MPNSYQCLKKDHLLDDLQLPKWLTGKDWMNKLHARWEPCGLAEICSSDGPYLKDKRLYRIAPDDPVSNLNWFQKLDITCQSADLNIQELF